MTQKIAVLPGDGIGAEIMDQAVRVLGALNLPLEINHAPVGGTAYDLHGHPLPPATLKLAQESNAVLFGAPNALTQNLYQIDFDSQLRQATFDINAHRDDALPNEGTTAPGDSGGPLILDQAFNEKTVIGVLSGGSRYFLAQPQSSYGGSAFYQPLYLFWDWIAQNNPYRYATAKAGDGNAVRVSYDAGPLSLAYATSSTKDFSTSRTGPKRAIVLSRTKRSSHFNSASLNPE